jgi:chromosome segregation and condensation protein ScpB
MFMSSAKMTTSAIASLSVVELRGAIGMTRERLEAAYEYLLEHPPLGLAIQRQGDEFFLVSAPEVGAAVERHLGNRRPVPLSRAALEVLAIVAYTSSRSRAQASSASGVRAATARSRRCSYASSWQSTRRA